MTSHQSPDRPIDAPVGGSPAAPPAAQPPVPPSVPPGTASRRDLPVFLIVAFGLCWLFALPVWVAAIPLDSTIAGVIGAAMMLTPTLGVVAVWLFGHRNVPFWQWAFRQTGIGLGASRKRTFALVAAAWLGVPLITVLAVAVSAALGLLSVDFGFSLFRQQLEQAVPGQAPPVDPEMLVVTQLVVAVLVAPLINAIPALGEEWGWRGWLLPYLERFGTFRALLLSGVIWGIWHAPFTLRGYNYPELGAWAAPAFVGFCVIAGVLLGWTRLYSGSVWPAVFAHAAINAWAGIVLIIGDAEDPPNLFVAGITGLVGWVLLAVLAAIVLRLRPLPPAPRAAVPADQAGGEVRRAEGAA